MFIGYFSELAAVTNISITLGVNFAENVFCGNADLTVKKVQAETNEIVPFLLRKVMTYCCFKFLDFRCERFENKQNNRNGA